MVGNAQSLLFEGLLKVPTADTRALSWRYRKLRSPGSGHARLAVLDRGGSDRCA